MVVVARGTDFFPTDDDIVMGIDVRVVFFNPAGADAGFEGHFCKFRSASNNFACFGIDLAVMSMGKVSVYFFHDVPSDISSTFKSDVAYGRESKRPEALKSTATVKVRARRELLPKSPIVKINTEKANVVMRAVIVGAIFAAHVEADGSFEVFPKSFHEFLKSRIVERPVGWKMGIVVSERNEGIFFVQRSFV